MNFAELERAHLTLAFLREFPDAVDVRIYYRQSTEKICAVVRLNRGDIRRYTFHISSDDDGYDFFYNKCASNNVVIEPLPESLMSSQTIKPFNVSKW